jgi:hypothetical protein
MGAEALAALAGPIRFGEITAGSADVEAIVRLLLENASRATVQQAASVLHAWVERCGDTTDPFALPALQALAWQAVTWRPPDQAEIRAPVVSHEWARVVRALTPHGRERAIETVLGALTRSLVERIDLDELAKELSAAAPDVLFEKLSARLLSPDTFGSSERLRPLFALVPDDRWRRFVEDTGVEGARAIARYLPRPCFADGRPVVSPLTRFVLERHGNDDRVYKEFAWGAYCGVWVGDLQERYEELLGEAAAFLGHPTPAIRRWAQSQSEEARAALRRDHASHERARFERA